MTVEVRPLGARCNIGCQYCFQNPERDAGNEGTAYDLTAIQSALLAEGSDFVLFGGEPLILPERDLEVLWSFGLERFGRNGIQTNGTLLTDRHVELFRKYRVTVGLSVDGPAELNDVRWAGTLEKTRAATQRSHEAIERLCAAGMPPGIIVTLHRNNATADKLPMMHSWIRRLEELGVRIVRLHLLEVDDEAVRRKYALNDAENILALQSFRALERELDALRFDVFADLARLLLGRDQDGSMGCVWMACDSYTTSAVRGVEGHGQRSNCGQTNKEGVNFVKSAVEGYERYLALYHTPQEHGGCQGCRFFLMCKGQCPGMAIDGDWRNRTEHCEVWKALFADVEADLLATGQTVLSVAPERRAIEAAMLASWASGRNTTIASLTNPTAVTSSAIPDGA